ncbi:unnamed protein product [Tilletia laevis]|uniref:Uncharacterized protein n=2 Tax=Tilletia TaxID=13289 RepID=A0A9N8LTM8_9BASI|nr:unnamed protein product [Tilletia caries]CAD6936628.1 unnamed protein product [Tilletia laevis]CAD6937463.1 unnamed protein product [Tilletia caries]CAD6940753.1 unnamed protein product [Tilletia caries]CAD6946065.1 unnamed protein product [Tilletia laevis]
MELFLTSDATTVILNSHGPTIFHAQVHLTIPRGTQPPSPRLDSIRVSLLCKESLSFPGGFIESSRWGSAVQVENVGQTVLRSGGTYTWEVQLKISDDMPAYERCRSGFCYQSLRAEATFGGFRLFRKTLEAEKSVFLVSPPESDDNFCYDHSQCGVGEGIGPILVQAQTQHLTVGGLLRTAAQIPAAAPDCELESVEFTLIQHTKLRSRKRPDRTAECGRKRVPLLKVDEKECEAMQWTFRLPNDMEMRPSTSCAGSSIQISHTMEARFYYSLDEEDDAGSEDSITSSSPSSLTGPVRRKKLPVKSRDVWTGKNVHLSHDQCVCGQSMEEVLGVEEEMAQVHAIGAGMGKMDAGFDGSIFAGKDDRREKR